MSTVAQRERSRYAALRRSRSADDPELRDAHRRMREEALIGAIGRAINGGPRMTPALRARIIGMLAVAERAKT